MSIAGVPRRSIELLLLGLVACGPERAASTDSTKSDSTNSDSTSSDSTNSDSTNSDSSGPIPSDTESGNETDEPETDDSAETNFLPFDDVFCSAAGGFTAPLPAFQPVRTVPKARSVCPSLAAAGPGMTTNA